MLAPRLSGSKGEDIGWVYAVEVADASAPDYNSIVERIRQMVANDPAVAGFYSCAEGKPDKILIVQQGDLPIPQAHCLFKK